MPRCRRHFALGIRGLMLLVLIVGGGIGWEARRAARQAWAVSVIERAGGRVYYGDQVDEEVEEVSVTLSMSIDMRPEPWTPAWLRRIVGDDAFRVVRRVDLAGLIDPRGNDNFPEHKGRAVAAIGALDGLFRVDAHGVSCDEEILERLAGLPRLRHLTLTSNAANPSDLGRLAKLPAIEDLEINLDGAPPWPVLDQIAGLSRLKYLGIAGIALAEPGDLDALKRLKGLEHLFLGGLPETGPWLHPIRELVHLKRLNIQDYRPDDDDLANLEFLFNLEELEVSDEISFHILKGIGDAGLSHLRNLKSLKTLRVDSSEITDAGHASLGNLKSLSVLWLLGHPVGNAGLEAISALIALEELHLETSAPLNDATLGRLASLKSLKNLQLSGPGMTDTGLAALAKLSALEALSFEGSSLGSPGLAHLAALDGLQYLNLSGSKLDDTGVEYLAKLHRVRFLHLRQTAITDAALPHLARLPALETLNLMGTTITDAGLMALREMPALRFVAVGDKAVTDEGITAFREARPEVRLYR